MANLINVTVSDYTLRRINEIIGIENAISKVSKNNWKERDAADFIRGAIMESIDRYDNYDDFKALEDIDDAIVRNNFKQIAEELNMSQAYISQRTGINPSNLSQIFNNRSQPRMDYFFKIWACLKCPPLYKCFQKENGENV